MARYVCDNNKKIVVLEIDKPQIDTELMSKALTDGFELKDEFHMTLLYSAAFEQLGEAGFTTFTDRLEQQGIPEYSFNTQVYYLNKSKIVGGVEYPRESIVVPIVSPQLYEYLKRASDGLIELDPFLHTTLFTRQDNPHAKTGIGIPTAADWKTLQPKLYFENWQTA